MRAGVLRCALLLFVLLLALKPGRVRSEDGAEEAAASATQSPANAKTQTSRAAARSNRSKAERFKAAIYPTTQLVLPLNSAIFQRVTQPRVTKPVKGWAFRLESDGPPGLAVTPSTGIVFVSEPRALHHLAAENDTTIELRIQVFGRDATFSHVVTLKVDFGETQCGNDSDPSEAKWCSEYTSRDKCRKGCGTASSGFCSWRSSAEGKMSQTSYATCSPDLAFCPNGECDELEEMDPHICPQDCTEHVFGSGMRNDLEGERGIVAASGVCGCSSLGKCTCSNEKSSPLKSQKPTELTRNRLGDEAPPDHRLNQNSPASRCGSTCMVFLIGCVALLLIILLATAMYTKRLVHFARIILSRREALLEPKESSLCQWSSTQAAELCGEQETAFSYAPNAKTSLLDSKWEFPRERLSIEKVLGEGEFGQVLQASAIDLPGVPGRTTVAVKALKDGAGSVELNDLLTEYEHLKEVSHPNIISLLGACTCPGGPIYIIIEFADRGSLRSYLRSCRRGGRDVLMAERLSLKTLISYSWQISKGMEYLSEMKMVHRDLAARNILLTSKGVCKVSDFGLSRDVYVDDTYFKQSRGKVPVKWMALESLSDQVYTSKSDVWSYGVLLWELLTLGIAPYPGIAIQNLFNLLQMGYRMENPVPNSNCKLYHLMQACWAVQPGSRPSFKHITSILNQILQEGADYLDITSDMVSNQEYMHFNSTSLDTEC